MARMSLLQVGRLFTLFLVTFFASVVFGINVHLLSTFNRSLVSQAILSTIISALTLSSSPAMLIVDAVCSRVPVTSYIVVEMSWLGSLCALWLATAAWVPQRPNQIICDGHKCSPHITVSRVCAILSFVILFAYTATLMTKTMALRRTSDRPARIWTGSVREVFSPNRLRMTIVHIPVSPSKTGFGFVVEQDDDPFHPEPVSSRSPSLLFNVTPPSPTGARSPSALLSPASPIAVSLPSPLSQVHLQA